MSETNIVELKPRKDEALTKFRNILDLDKEKLDAIIDEEGTQMDEAGVAPTVGNVFTLIAKCVLRCMMGDETFNQELPTDDDKSANETLMKAADGLAEKVKAAFDWTLFADDDIDGEPDDE